MKKLLYIIYIIIFVISVGIYKGICFSYIPSLAESTFEKKKEALEMEIKKQIKELWGVDNALLYFKDIGGAKYLRMDMDAVRFIDMGQDANKQYYGLAWDLFPVGRYANSVRIAFETIQSGSFSDLYDMYYIQRMPWMGTYIVPNKDYYSIKVFNYIPLFVGYKKGNRSLRNFRPSFDECLKDAKKYIQEEDEDNRMYYNPLNEDKVYKIVNLCNDYFYFQYQDDLRTYMPDYIDDFDFANFNFKNHDKFRMPTGYLKYIYNDFCKVYYLIERSGTMYLTFNDTKYYQDMNSFILEKRNTCNIGFILFLIISIVILIVSHITINHKANIRKKSLEIRSDDELSIYEKVIKLSNPERFIKPYQPEKLEKANRLYSTALKNKFNTVLLEQLLEEAIKL